MSDYQNLKDKKEKDHQITHPQRPTTYPKQVIKTQTRQVQGEGPEESHLRLYLANLPTTYMFVVTCKRISSVVG